MSIATDVPPEAWEDDFSVVDSSSCPFVPPVACSRCGAEYYLHLPAGPFSPGDPIRFVCECGQDNVVGGEPCAGALVGSAERYRTKRAKGDR